MRACVTISGAESDTFAVNVDVKQGYALAHFQLVPGCRHFGFAPLQPETSSGQD